MENKNHVLVHDIENLLNKYLNSNTTEEFSRIIESSSKTSAEQKNYSKSNKHLNKILNNSSNKRELVQCTLSFVDGIIQEEPLLKFMLELGHLMINSGELDFAAEICEDLIIKINGNETYVLVEAEAYLALAKISWAQAYWEQSTRYVQKSYEIFQLKNDWNGLAKCENMLGTIFGEQGDLQQAEEHFKKGLSYLSESGDLTLRVMFEINISIILSMHGEHKKALWHLKNALHKCITLKDNKLTARIRHNLGMLYSKLNDFHSAIEEFNASIDISSEYGYLSNCAISYIGKAYIYTKLNNNDLAEAFTNKALEISYKINDRLSIADVYRIKGIIQSDLENFELSEEMFENSLRLNEDLENQFNSAETKIELSKTYKKFGKKDESNKLLSSANSYYNLIKAKAYIDELLNAQYN